MCGLVLLAGEQSEQLISACTTRLQHRGPDEHSIYTGENFSIGFRRLAINGDMNEGRQPYETQGWLAAVNGEIYNYQELAEQYQLTASSCDTSVVLPLYLKLKEKAIDILDGFFAAVLLNPTRTEAICLRDSMGKKPLFVGATRGIVFITSELKALKSADWLKALPKGVSRVDLQSGEVTLLKGPVVKRSDAYLKEALTESVRKRLPRGSQPVAVFLSGGLDSSLIASIASKFRNDIVYFTLGNRASNDSIAAQTVAKYLDLKNFIVVRLPSADEMPSLISQVVHATESYNPSIISNGLATYLLARAARDFGIKIVLTGEGADELFGGYHHFLENEPWQETRVQLINDMTFTELRRLDMACMANGIEPRCPFLDQNVKSLSDQMSFSQLYRGELNKVALRQSFEGYLPEEILYRKKISCDVGSGIRGMVVRYLKRNGRSEREELLEIWKQHFSFEPSESYFHSYPAFDALIDVRGDEHR